MPRRESAVRRIGVNLLCLVLSGAVASGCTSWRRVPLSEQSIAESVRPGDTVRAVTHDGRKVDPFTVTAATKYAVAGERRGPPVARYRDLQEMVAIVPRPDDLSKEDVTIRFSDVARMDRQTFSKAKTAVLVAGVTVAALSVAALLAFASAMPDSASPHRAAPQPVAP